MNINVLKKCVDELNSEQPNISYIKGMLETLIEMQPVAALPNRIVYKQGVPLSSATIEKSDEENEQEDLARRYAGGPVAELQ